VRVATWNINNVTRRLDQLLDWLARTSPDVVALQELKTPTAAFPGEALKAAGYHSLVVGQKTWNGVALLSRRELVPVLSALPGDPTDKEARYIEAASGGVLFSCLYLPNGNPQPGPKFDYKLRWFERLRARAAELWAAGEPVVLLGDWNVVPTDADIYKPDTWRDDALLQPEAREAFAQVLSQGWTDVIKAVYPDKVPFTFWDYRRKRWERNAGLRIDHILLSASITVQDAGVDREERGKEGASDHAPVWATIKVTKAKALSAPAKKRSAPRKLAPSDKARRPVQATADPHSPMSEPDMSKAVKAVFPQTLKPQLATLTAGPPASGSWVIEHKFDGYRAMVKIVAGKVQLFTRGGNDWTDKVKSLAKEVESIGIDKAWMDGEMVVINEQGVPDFNRLQNAFDNSRTKDIVLYLFDLLFLGELDLRQVPLRDRRRLLRDLLKGNTSERIHFSEELPSTPAAVLRAACEMGLEGVMLKDAESAYVSRRSDSWLKLKCQRRQEFVVIGFTDRANSTGEVGSLLLGYYDDGGKLHFAGSVGTGWSSAQGRELHKQAVGLEAEAPSLDPKEVKPGRWSKRVRRAERWVRPEMVVEVAFGEWTPDGSVRHATFRGVRTDKPAASIRRELATAPMTAAKPLAQRRTSVKISNADRVIDPSTGLTKIDLINYYESVAERILPHLRLRPVSLVRAPQGITGEVFFQKHSESRIRGLTELAPELWPGHEALLSVDTIEGLISAAQLNVVEFHTWNSTTKRIDQPDRVIFDLDPGEGVTWAHVQDAAMLTRTMLEELGLKSWLKTSGGKGLHVVVPLAPNLDYEVVKDFSRAVVAHIAKTIPQRFVAKSGGSNRVGKVFIDYLRNGHGQTTVAAFSARARPGLGVSVPVSWDQMPTLKSGAQWTVATAGEHLSFERGDPWIDYWTSKQTLSVARKKLELGA
jgi:bifunctional non-homologous end joining protein LigD